MIIVNWKKQTRNLYNVSAQNAVATGVVVSFKITMVSSPSPAQPTYLLKDIEYVPAPYIFAFAVYIVSPEAPVLVAPTILPSVVIHLYNGLEYKLAAALEAVISSVSPVLQLRVVSPIVTRSFNSGTKSNRTCKIH